jgi:hypothetical protein
MPLEKWLARGKVTPEQYHAAFHEALKSQPFAPAVERKSLEEFQRPGYKFFFAEGVHVGENELPTAGAAVDPEGTLVSVFKVKGTAGWVLDRVLREACCHAFKFDAFATRDGFLLNLYSQYGFVPVARVAFNDNFAPLDWNYQLFGRPDVVYAVRKGPVAPIPAFRYEPASVPLVPSPRAAEWAQFEAFVPR